MNPLQSNIKKKYFETGLAVMEYLQAMLWTKEKCRIVFEYDPAEEMVKVEKTFIDDSHGEPDSQQETETSD